MYKKISVIMGVLNAEDCIENAVISIEKQTEQNIELIICDDGSTDHTYSILQELQKQYGNIVLIKNEKNRGLAFSLNCCFELSTGEYIARMDADDISMPERLRIQKEFLNKHPEYDVVGCEMIMLDDEQRETYSQNDREPGKDVFPLRVPFPHPTVMMRRSVMERLGGYSVEKKTKRCEDVELWYRFFEYGMRGYNLPDYLYVKIQGINDYKRRKVVHGIELFQIHLRGLGRIHAPVHKYFLAVKPIVSAMIPKKIMMRYHALKFRKKG